MFFRVFFLVVFAPIVYGGTLCPPREDIYPCSCANIHQTKKIIHTIINCHRLRNSDVLQSIFSTLRTIQIDQFHLYDSFWESETKTVLPQNWWTQLKIKELEIVDSTMSDCFACESKSSCANKNSATIRFTAINVSSSEKICSICKVPAGNVYPWTGCLKNLKHFRFSHGQLTYLGSELFPHPMKQLTLLNLTYNKISKIDPAAFQNLVQLTELDLSHNAIEYVDFFRKGTSLRYLDLSWNNIQTIGDIFNYVSYLETLNLQYNEIVKLPEKEWKKVPKTLRYLGLEDNPLHCDCDIQWVNQTFAVHTIVLGICATPEEYENTILRRASRYLAERCDDDGNIGTRKRIQSTTPTTFKLI